MMNHTNIHQWFVLYGINPLIGWEVIDIAHDVGDLPNDEDELFQHVHTYIVSMIDAATDDPTVNQLDWFLKHLVPLIFAVAPHLTIDQRMAVIAASQCGPGRSPLIEQVVLNTLLANRG